VHLEITGPTRGVFVYLAINISDSFSLLLSALSISHSSEVWAAGRRVLALDIGGAVRPCRGVLAPGGGSPRVAHPAPPREATPWEATASMAGGASSSPRERWRGVISPGGGSSRAGGGLGAGGAESSHCLKARPWMGGPD